MLFGYDVEMASQDSVGFLEGAAELHERFGVPWTIYLTGETVERCTDAIRTCMHSPLVTVAQHTYSHVLLKSYPTGPWAGAVMKETRVSYSVGRVLGGARK